MNIKETATLLAKVQAFDNRRVDEATIMAWHEALGDLPFGECSEAVAEHFRSGDGWLMPAGVRRSTPTGKPFDPTAWMNQ